MKKKIWVKIISTVLAVALVFQVSLIGSLAAPKETNDQSPITTLGLSDADKEMLGELGNVLSRYIFYAFLYNTGHSGRVDALQMINLIESDNSDGSSSILAEFHQPGKLVYSNVTVLMMFGDKKYWSGALKDPTNTIMKCVDILSVYYGTLAGAMTGDPKASQVVRSGVSSLMTMKDLEKKVANMGEDATLGCLIGMLYDTKVLIFYTHEYVSMNSLVVAEEGIPFVPENVVLPNWIANGPPVEHR